MIQHDDAAALARTCRRLKVALVGLGLVTAFLAGMWVRGGEPTLLPRAFAGGVVRGEKGPAFTTDEAGDTVYVWDVYNGGPATAEMYTVTNGKLQGFSYTKDGVATH